MTTLALHRGLGFQPFTDQSTAASDAGRYVRCVVLDATRHARANATDWRRTVKGVIEQVASETSAANWDGEGALPLSSHSRLFGHAFVDVLPFYLPPPDVIPETDGWLAFSWDLGKGLVFSVSVSPNGMLHYAGLLGGGRKSHGVERFSGSLPQPIQAALEDIST